jgi:hypothetical protein
LVADIFPSSSILAACGRYPQQPPGLAAGFAPAGVDKNFFRQGSLQKKKVFPSRSALRAVASSTVIPQMGSLVTDFDSFMVMFLSWLLLFFYCDSDFHVVVPFGAWYR